MPPAVIQLPVRRIAWPPTDGSGPESIVMREWLVTNALGGYASGTVSGVITRRYHGLLIAALAAPLGRTVMLSHLAEEVRFADGRRCEIAGCLTEFRVEGGLPVWRYAVEGVTIEKRLFMPHMQNTVHVVYELLAGADRIELALRPSVNFRPQEAPVSEPLGGPYQFHATGEEYLISLPGSPLPPLRMMVSAVEPAFTLEGLKMDSVLYPVEESRGYQARGDLWSPGYFRLALLAGGRGTLTASTEPLETLTAVGPEAGLDFERERRQRLVAQAIPDARAGVPAELVLAADAFVINPIGRTEETARAHAYGDEVRTVIAGYHWFTDWGRDTMIGLEGLTLVTGRHVEAAYILRTFAHYVRHGLIPNLFPEGRKEGLYHTADATLWFFHAIQRYVDTSGDRLTLSLLYPTLKDIIAWHVRGTDFGIRLDPRDGLLTQGAPGCQLTWMDAKVDDWVVTPRRGKAVEINALWFNALTLMHQWAAEQGDPACAEYAQRAEAARRAFNERFWFERGNYLYDVVDGEPGTAGGEGVGAGPPDEKCRPNQIFAVALPSPVLARERWESVVRTVRDRLLTPVGLRSLAPDDPDFKPRYFGDLRARDAAYHQGTVWAWLAGPFVDAWLRVYPDDVDGARAALAGVVPHLDEGCIGSISEVFDAEEPFTPRGCISQAWSVGEVLRAWVKLNRR